MRTVILGALVASSLLLGASMLTRGQSWGDDFASYIMQAQSLLDGSTAAFVEQNHLTIFGSSSQMGPVAYPWGYPAVLAPVLRFAGLQPLALKWPALGFFAGFLVCLYLLIKDRLPAVDTWLLVALFAFNPPMLLFLDEILSDIPFLCVATGVLCLISRADGARGSAGRDAAIGVAVFAAAFLRTTGALLLVSFAASQLLRIRARPDLGRDRMRGLLVATVAFAVCWWVSSRVFPSGEGSYVFQLEDLGIASLIQNVRTYFSLFRTFFGDGPFWIAAYLAMVVAAAIGAWHRRAEDLPWVAMFVIYLGALIVWPKRQGLRFVFPLLPLFVYFVFQGVAAVARRMPPRHAGRLRRGAQLGWLAVIVLFVVSSGQKASANLRAGRATSGPFDAVSAEMFRFIETATPSGSLVVFEKPRAMRLMTRRNAVKLVGCDRVTRGDYVVVMKAADGGTAPADRLDDCAVASSVVFENRGFIVYRVTKPGADRAPGPA